MSHNKATCVSHPGPVLCIATQLCFTFCFAKLQHSSFSTARLDSACIAQRVEAGSSEQDRPTAISLWFFPATLRTFFKEKCHARNKTRGASARHSERRSAYFLNFLRHHKAKKHWRLEAASHFLHFHYLF